MELVADRPKLKTGQPTSGLFVLVGNPKSGKTSFAASFPDSYVIELEANGGDRVAGRIHDIHSFEDFRKVLPLVMGSPEIKTVVIDSLDMLSDYFKQDVAKSMGLESIDETKKGVDGYEKWGAYNKAIEKIVGYLKASNKLVILIAHCKAPTMDSSGVLTTPAGINMPGKAGSYVASQADIIGYTYRRQVGPDTSYFLTFQGGPLGIWGSRVEELNDKTIQLPKANPYSAFEAIFVDSKKPTRAAVAAGSK